MEQTQVELKSCEIKNFRVKILFVIKFYWRELERKLLRMLPQIFGVIVAMTLVDTQSLRTASSCDNFWSYQSDRGEKFGLLRIPNINNSKIDLKAYFSINANLPSVSFSNVWLPVWLENGCQKRAKNWFRTRLHRLHALTHGIESLKRQCKNVF